MQKLVVTMALLASASIARAEPIDPFAVRNPPASVAVPARSAATQEPAVTRVVFDPGKRRKQLAVGIALGGCALWATSGLLSRHWKAQYDRAAKAYFEMPTIEDANAANDAQSKARYIAAPIFAAGAIAVGAAIVLYTTAPDRLIVEKRPLVVPTASADSVGVVVSGGF